jgi:hypothetical protein
MYQEQVLDVAVEAPIGTTEAELTELALQQVDDGKAAFECVNGETRIVPPSYDDVDGYTYLLGGTSVTRFRLMQNK